jgi:hypothetical protein
MSRYICIVASAMCAALGLWYGLAGEGSAAAGYLTAAMWAGLCAVYARGRG